MNSHGEKILKILPVFGIIIALTIIYFVTFKLDNEVENNHEKVGFIITGDVRQKGWNGSHYNGIKKACEDLNLQLLVHENIPENSGKCPEAVKDLISQGAKIIFLMSFNYPKEVHDIMEENPNIYFVGVSTLEKSKNFTSCFARMYQGRYLSGVLAGMKTKTNKVGFVAAMKNSEVIRGINAFALGVQRVNPNAKVYAIFTGAWKDEKIEEKNAEILIKNYNADVLTYHQNEDTTGKVAEKFDVDFIAYNAILENYSDHYLASVICNWDLFYKEILLKHLKGELSAMRNYWIGTQQGAINLSQYSNSVSDVMRLNLNAIRNELVDSKNLIFAGEIYDNEGNLRCEENQAISDYELLRNVHWFVRGVEVVE